jgi:PilZ domain
MEQIDREPARNLLERGARLPLREPVLVSWQDEGVEIVERARTASISRGGCAISSRRFFRSGSRVRIEYKGNTMDGCVVYSLKDNSGNSFQTGIGFDRDAQEFWQIELEIPAGW